MTNLPTLNTQNTDDRPLPLIMADRWGFSLQHHEQGGALHYCIQEWIAGLTGESLRKSQKMFSDMRPQLSVSIGQLDYTAADSKTYRVPFTDDKGLYIITQNLRATAKRPMLKEIQQYLARAGAFADAARIDPESAVESIESARRAKWERDGRDSAWIANRQNGIYTRKQLTAEIQRVLGTGEHMGKLTNTTYKGVLGTDAFPVLHRRC